MLHVESSTWGRGERAALSGTARAQAGRIPQPQLPQRSAVPDQGRWGAREETAAMVVWVVWGRATAVVFPEAAESRREREAALGPMQEGRGN